MKLVPVDHDPFADEPAAPAASPKLVPVDHDPFADSQPAPSRSLLSSAKDVGRSLESGVDAGVAGLIGLPNAAIGLAEEYLAGPAARAVSHGILRVLGRTPKGAAPEGFTPPSVADGFPSAEAVSRSMRDMAGPEYKPQTIAGEVAHTIGEFVPNAVGGAPSALGKMAQVVVPALTSEGAGRAARAVAPEYEGAARFGGALVGGIGTAMAQAPRGPNALLRESLEGIRDEDLAAAGRLIEESRNLPGGGVGLTLDEALNRVTEGRAGRLSQLSRVVANGGGEGGRAMADFYARRPGEIDAVGRAAFDGVAPATSSPTGLGFDLQGAARAGIAQTPEGAALAQAREAVGPRTSADRAGQVIQREMTGVRAGREAVRKLQGDRDYDIARAAPERVGIERTVTVERPGEPLLQTLDNNAGAPLRYDPPPRGPDTLGALAPTRPDAPPVPAGAKSLARYIAENGGIGLERGDVKAAGLDRFRQPGVANLVREDGKGIDAYWRTKLIEEGYLPPDRAGGMERNIHDELIGLLEQEQRGRRTYPWDWQGHDERSGFGQMRDEFQASASTALADVRKALAEAGVDPRTVDKGALDRAAAALVRGEDRDPLSAFERVVMAAREPMSGPSSRMVPTTVTEQISAPRFGQVNPQAALDLIDRQLLTAKGDVRAALEATRRDLLERSVDPVSGRRETDLSVDGLHQARERLDRRVAEALERRDGILADRLGGARSALDESLKAAPEMAVADANFAANSRPLDVFAGDAPLGRVTRQDPLTGRMATPTEEVPSHLKGATAARELLANATPEARTAYGNRLATQILDGATDKRGAIDPDRLNGLLRDNADVLEMMPEVYGRLDGVVRARDGLDRVLASPLGRIAEQPDVKRAIGAVFPANPLPGSTREVAEAMGALARNRPTAARELARIHLEGVFNEATQETKGLAKQYGGAGFASAVRGNSQQRANLEAVIRALPEGDTIWVGLDRVLSTLETTGYKPVKGSDTAFNQVIQERLKNGQGPVSAAITEAVSNAAAGGGIAGSSGALGGAVLGLKKAIGGEITKRKLSVNGAALARALTDPAALPDLRALTRSADGTPNAQLFTNRLLALAASATAPTERGR